MFDDDYTLTKIIIYNWIIPFIVKWSNLCLTLDMFDVYPIETSNLGVDLRLNIKPKVERKLQKIIKNITHKKGKIASNQAKGGLHSN